MHKLLFSFFILLAGHVRSQQNSKFEYWISSLDKAGYSRITYHISENGITIKGGPYDFIYFAKNYEKDKVLFKTKVDSLEKPILLKMGSTVSNDILKSQYDNLCIIDGMILTFQFEWGIKEKSTTLSNYYLARMQPFVDFVNKKVPPKYQIYYDKKELEKRMQDCPPEKILD